MAEHEPSDEQCVALTRRGERRGFDTLVRRYQDRLFRFVLPMIGARDESLELVQETFVRAWQALDSWQPQATFKTWLFRIASNAAIDALRRRTAVPFVALDDDYDAPAAGADPQEQLQTRQRLHALVAALGRLPADQREIVLLREVEGMSYDEISSALGISVGTVKSRLARGREALIALYRSSNA
jgi:RNA polymerase sigma-70 factor (ECF subfamily)